MVYIKSEKEIERLVKRGEKKLQKKTEKAPLDDDPYGHPGGDPGGGGHRFVDHEGPLVAFCRLGLCDGHLGEYRVRLVFPECGLHLPGVSCGFSA